MENQHISRKAIILFAATTVLLAAGFFLFPWLGDDLFYRLPFRDYHLNGAPADFGDMWDYFVLKHNTDNSRLPTLLMIGFGFLPDWFNTLCSTVAVFFTLLLFYLLVGRRASMVYAAMVVFCFIILMPWHEMYEFDFQMAYIWPSALALWLTKLLFERRGSSIGVAALALTVGVWHESIGLPLFAGLCGAMVLFPQMRTRRTVIASLALLTGLVWLYMSPGGQQYRDYEGRFVGRLVMILPFCLPAATLLVWVVVRSLRRRRLPAPLLTYLVIGAVVAMAVNLYFRFGPRLAWWSCLSAWVGLLIMLGESSIRVSRAVRRCAAVGMVLLTFVHLIVVDYISARLNAAYKYSIEQYRANPDSTIYSDIITRSALPLICLQKPYADMFFHSDMLRCVSDFYMGPDAPLIKVVHECLRDYRPELGTLIPQSRDELRYYKGFIVGDATEGNPEVEWLFIDYGTGPTWRPFLRQSFTGADGKTYTVYTPDVTFSLSMIFRPQPVSAYI